MPHPIIFNGSLGLGLMLVGLGLNATLRPNDHLQRLEFPIPTEPLAKKFSLALMKLWGIRNITVGVLISIIWTTGDENLMAKALSATLAMPITDGNLNMRLLSNFCLPALAVAGSFVTPRHAEDQCRGTIGESCWPSTKTWGSLNSTVDGHLIRYIPPGAICYKSHPSYNPSTHRMANAGCTPVYENGASIYGDVKAGERGCSNGVLPTYVVNATTVEHVTAALEFAGEHNIRLVIKNTGHASNGRNLGNSSLSSWTHDLKSIDLREDFSLTCPNSQDAPSPRMAATVGAGVQDGEMFEALAAQNALAVGGTSNDVGVVGWATGRTIGTDTTCSCPIPSTNRALEWLA
ncbi:isoamyl alcohol oxidase [Fusarium mundagurra]|uniref:Isoamyl alcohol oxidase n=1 Tax=Fusarium mundagurra TaxID=1567541 RepID=A0A8H6D515_9HYPO|nr:isoamyl alcohol oxidase [Fusarium mundagurra]